jgi:hypothetical protein
LAPLILWILVRHPYQLSWATVPWWQLSVGYRSMVYILGTSSIANPAGHITIVMAWLNCDMLQAELESGFMQLSAWSWDCFSSLHFSILFTIYNIKIWGNLDKADSVAIPLWSHYERWKLACVNLEWMNSICAH